MSDNVWEVVGGPKKKPKGPKAAANNGEIPGVKWSSAAPNSSPSQVSAPTQKKGKRVKHKGPRDYKIAKLPSLDSDSEESNEGKSSQDNAKKNEIAKKKVVPKPVVTQIRKEGLEAALKKVPEESLLKFFSELRSAGGSVGDVYLSWIKYSADALNTRLSSAHVSAPDPSQFPNNLLFPKCPNVIVDAIHQIIGETSEFNPNPDFDVIGLSYSHLLASIPTLLQRGDSGWGYLIFLRELSHLYPDLPVRRSKTIFELMESFSNRKEVGLCILWTVSQSALFSSDHLLKIVVDYLLPYYNYKNYKSFVLSALTNISTNIKNITTTSKMGGGEKNVNAVIEPDQFIEFFEAAFDPKKRRDFEDFYTAIRNLVLKHIKGRGAELFLKLLPTLGAKDFMPMSHQGKETFEILNGCLANDSACFEVWKRTISKYPKESVALLNYLSKNAENVNYSKKLESILLQSDEFAIAAVKTPELIRGAKKLQTGIKRVEAAKTSRFSWKWSCFLLLITIIGLIWLDVAENGRGFFAKSKTGRFLEGYGLLDDAEYLMETSSKMAIASYELAGKALGRFIEIIRPMLQVIEDQVQTYIPQVAEYTKIITTYVMNFCSSVFTFVKEDVFTGALSPENLRKIAKNTLSVLWTYVYFMVQKVYEFIEKYLLQ